jgi:hypothetical protein
MNKSIHPPMQKSLSIYNFQPNEAIASIGVSSGFNYYPNKKNENAFDNIITLSDIT